MAGDGVPSSLWGSNEAGYNGTCTPQLLFGGTNTGMTYSVNTCQYVKRGTLITYWLEIILTAIGTSTGNCTIQTNIPWTAGSAITSPSSVMVNSYNTSTTGDFISYIQTGTSNIAVQYQGSGTLNWFTNTDFLSTTRIRVSGSYFTA